MLRIQDLRYHTTMSFIKSGIRIFGYIILSVDLFIGVVILVISEAIGIFEEFKEL